MFLSPSKLYQKPRKSFTPSLTLPCKLWSKYSPHLISSIYLLLESYVVILNYSLDTGSSGFSLSAPQNSIDISDAPYKDISKKYLSAIVVLP